jgi:hypothetical protein
MTSMQPPTTTADHEADEPPLINPSVAPPSTAAPVAVVERQSPLKRLLAAFGIGRVR